MDIEEDGGAVGSWRIARKPSILGGEVGSTTYRSSGTAGRLRPSFTFPSPCGTRFGYQGGRPVSSTYSRHSHVSCPPLSSPGSSFYHHTPAYHQERRRRWSQDLTQMRGSQTQQMWPVRPLRSSVPLATSSTTEHGGGGGGRRLSEVQMYSGKLQDPEKGISTQERMVGGTAQRVFTGADALEWFSEHMVGVTSVEQAKNVGEQLLDAGLIVKVSGQVSGDSVFHGSPNALYQFTDNNSTQTDEVTIGQDITQNQQGEKLEQRGKGKCIVQ